jgi:hypothetical protein
MFSRLVAMDPPRKERLQRYLLQMILQKLAIINDWHFKRPPSAVVIDLSAE